MEISKKCVNLDWVEVFCLEPEEMDANYYKALGWNVNVRAYGTPLYHEMFTLLNQDGKPFLEIRRNPISLKENGGIFERGACHIKLANRVLYQWNPISQLQNFLDKYHYKFKGVTRLDICCDQLLFDNNINPQGFIHDYMSNKIAKNRNSNLSAHGTERKDGRNWNSLKWGAPSSPLSTKIYDKTLELKQSSNKLYIKDAWVKAGLCEYQKVRYEYKDKKTKTQETRSKMVLVPCGTSTEEERPIEDVQEVTVWRVEFSIKSEARNWVSLEGSHKIEISLNKFVSKERIMLMFLIIAKWCLDFMKTEYTANGTLRRKDRCERIELFSQKNIEHSFKPHRITIKEDPTRTEKIIYNRLIRLSKEGNTKLSEEQKNQCLDVANFLAMRHGNFWITDEQKQRWKDHLKLVLEEAGKMEMEITHFQEGSWIYRWEHKIITEKERNFIKRNRKEYVHIILKRANRILQEAEQKENWARSEISFWSGKTMPPKMKEILYDLPF